MRAQVRKPLAVLSSLTLLCTIFSVQALAVEESFAYDENGNLVQDARFHYEYDGMNMLSRVREGDADGRVLEEYWYDHSGRRQMKVQYLESGGNITTYYVNENFETVIDENGVREDFKYVWANGERVAKIYENGSKVYYLNDHLGSSSVLVDENGNELERIQYYPFGAVKSSMGDEKYGYNSKELDDTGLLYYGARYYNPQLRRWTQPDSIIQHVFDPQSLNRFGYARNNPIRLVDPNGNSFEYNPNDNLLYRNGDFYGYIEVEVQFYYGDRTEPSYYLYYGKRQVSNEGTITFETFDLYAELEAEKGRDADEVCANCALDIVALQVELVKKATDVRAAFSSLRNLLGGKPVEAVLDWVPCGDFLKSRETLELKRGDKLPGYDGDVTKIRTNDIRILLNNLAPHNVVYDENLRPRSQKYGWLYLSQTEVSKNLRYTKGNNEDNDGDN